MSGRGFPKKVRQADHALLLRGLLAGVIRWEPFSPGHHRGELCFAGLRYSTRLDVDGCPELHADLRQNLTRTLAAKEVAAHG